MYSRSLEVNEKELQGLVKQIPEYRNWDTRDIKHGAHSKIVYFGEPARKVGGSFYGIAGQFGSTVVAHIRVFGVYAGFRHKGLGTEFLSKLEHELVARHKVDVIEGMAFLPVEGGAGGRRLLAKFNYDLSGPVPRKELRSTSSLPSSA